MDKTLKKVSQEQEVSQLGFKLFDGLVKSRKSNGSKGIRETGIYEQKTAGILKFNKTDKKVLSNFQSRLSPSGG